jgi:hypothetical protein
VRSRLRSLGAGLACVAVAVLVWVSGANGATGTTLVIRVEAVVTSRTTHDAPPRGLSKGDRYVARSRLTNVVAELGRRAGAVVGTDEETSTLGRGGTTWTSVGSTRLPGGTIRVRGHGTVAPGSIGRYVITGGTGRFAGARGALEAQVGDPSLNVYRVTLPARI